MPKDQSFEGPLPDGTQSSLLRRPRTFPQRPEPERVAPSESTTERVEGSLLGSIARTEERDETVTPAADPQGSAEAATDSPPNIKKNTPPPHPPSTAATALSTERLLGTAGVVQLMYVIARERDDRRVVSAGRGGGGGRGH